MPRRAGHPCRYPGCPAIVHDVPYCEQHARERQVEYDAQRGSAASRGYGYRWRQLRMMVLAAQPLCADPYHIHPLPVLATDVDHVVPLDAGGTDELDNLQALCHSCHSRKTSKADGRWGKGDQISIGRLGETGAVT